MSVNYTALSMPIGRSPGNRIPSTRIGHSCKHQRPSPGPHAPFGVPCLRFRLSLSITLSDFLTELTWHSHTTKTRQPSLRSLAMFLLSRPTLAANLVNQNSWLLFGVVATEHPAWRCQKQPCTKTTARCLGSTMSGRPSILLTWRRYL